VIAADELGVPIERVNVVAGDTISAPNEGYTAGSLSIEHGGSAMRWAAALTRTLFANAAARRLGVPAGDIRMENGRFVATQSNMGVDYGDLATEVDLDVDAAALSRPSFIGVAEHIGLDRLDLPAKLSGAAYIHDLDLPGLCHGRVLRPPHPHARLAALDRTAIEAMAGVVTVVVDGSFVGVVARREEEAEAALRRAERDAQWQRVAELPPGDDDNAWMETATAFSVTDLVNDERPDPATVLRHQGVYSRPYIAHASLAPSCALAQWQDGRLTVYSHTQGVYPLRGELAAALDVPVDVVDVIHAMSAGCYGHNGADDVALDAALLSRAAGVPVLCRWSRTDELTWSPFGAAMRMRLSAGLDANGRITEWTHDVFSPPHLARPTGGVGGVNLLERFSD
jgi:CO/xanthine dehydrogenase Mo-binding subunit